MDLSVGIFLPLRERIERVTLKPLAASGIRHQRRKIPEKPFNEQLF
jgi:hypothetical protein